MYSFVELIEKLPTTCSSRPTVIQRTGVSQRVDIVYAPGKMRISKPRHTNPTLRDEFSISLWRANLSVRNVFLVVCAPLPNAIKISVVPVAWRCEVGLCHDGGRARSKCMAAIFIESGASFKASRRAIKFSSIAPTG
jgi:hypothetical protein